MFHILGEAQSLYDFVVPSNGQYRFQCSVCGKEGNDKGNLKKHVENVHYPGFHNYFCKHCNAEFTTRNSLNHHISKMHR